MSTYYLAMNWSVYSHDVIYFNNLNAFKCQLMCICEYDPVLGKCRPFYNDKSDSIDITDFIKQTNFFISCNVCYLNLYISSKPWFYTFFFTIS